MNSSSIFREESGFTLQETIVVIVLGMLLVGFSYSLYQFVTSFVSRNLDKRRHHESVEHMAAMISLEVERSRSAIATDSSFILTFPHAKTVEYKSIGERLLRNGEVVSSRDSSKWTASWHQLEDSAHIGIRPVEIAIKGYWKRDSVAVVARTRPPWSSQGVFGSGVVKRETKQ